MYYLSDIHDVVVQLAARVKKEHVWSGYVVIDQWTKMLSEGVQLTIDFGDERREKG